MKRLPIDRLASETILRLSVFTGTNHTFCQYDAGELEQIVITAFMKAIDLHGNDLLYHEAYDRTHDQNSRCVCGHIYHRHWDWGDGYRPGCKYCECMDFREKR